MTAMHRFNLYGPLPGISHTQAIDLASCETGLLVSSRVRPPQAVCSAFDHDLDPALDSPAVAALTLGGIWPTEPQRCYLRVFINHEQPSAQVDIEHVCHVRCLAFMSCHPMTQPATVSLDITDVVRDLKQARRLDVADFEVQLLPVSFSEDPPTRIQVAWLRLEALYPRESP